MTLKSEVNFDEGLTLIEELCEVTCTENTELTAFPMQSVTALTRGEVCIPGMNVTLEFHPITWLGLEITSPRQLQLDIERSSQVDAQPAGMKQNGGDDGDMRLLICSLNLFVSLE